VNDNSYPIHPMSDLAGLYALGLLDPVEAEAFEAHLAQGCSFCQGELGTFLDVTGALALSGAVVTPPRSLRARVLARAKAEAAARAGRTVVRAWEGLWLATDPGVSVKYLFCDPANAHRTMLMRVAPGIRRSAHRHHHTEEVFVLEGELQLGTEVLRPGDFSGAPGGTVHPETWVDSGCLCLCRAGEANDPAPPPAAGVFEPGQVIVRRDDRPWQATGPGAESKSLFHDHTTGTTTALVRLDSGASLAPSMPLFADEIFVLHGSGYLGGHRLGAGDYYREAPGHPRDVRSAEAGCTLLMVSADTGDASSAQGGRR